MTDAVPAEDPVSSKQLKEQSLYGARVKRYPKDVSGTYRRIKGTVLIVLLGICYVVPWLRWGRGPGLPDQAVLIDMPARRSAFTGWRGRVSRSWARRRWARSASFGTASAVTDYRVFVTAPPEAIDDEVETTTMTLRDQATGAEATNAHVFQGPG